MRSGKGVSSSGAIAFAAQPRVVGLMLGAEDLTGIDIDGDGQVGAPTMLADDKYLPGDLGFDPLGLYAGKSAEWKRDMQLKELNNGRLAMIAITGYAFNEAATKVSVIKSIGL